MAVGILIAGCEPLEGGGGAPTYEPRVIRGITIDGDEVEVTITRGTAARAVLTPANGDNYVMRLNSVEISRGKIALSENRILFYPSNGGATFTATYSGGADFVDAVIHLYELPTTGGGVAPIGPPAGVTGPSAAELAAAALASELNTLYGTGTVAVSADKVTLLKNVTLSKTLAIVGGVTLVVPGGLTLNANVPALTGGKDPDLKPDGTPGPAGSGSYQITGSGTLDVKGTIVVRNRALRAANTIIYPTATYNVYGWNGSAMDDLGNLVGSGPPASFTDLITLATGTLEVAYKTVTGDDDVHDAYTFTLKGNARLNGPFKLGATSSNNQDKVIIASGGSLDASAGTASISGGGTMQVASGGKILFGTTPPTGDGKIEVFSGGTLEIAENPGSPMKVIGTTPEYLYQPGPGAVIEMKPGQFPTPGPTAENLFEYIFRGGIISTRLQNAVTVDKNVWIQVPHTVANGATLKIPSGSRVVVVSFGGYVVNPGQPQALQYGWGSLETTGTGIIEVIGELAVDGPSATIKVSALADITGIAKVGYLKSDATIDPAQTADWGTAPTFTLTGKSKQ